MLLPILATCLTGCNNLLDIGPPVSCGDTREDPNNCGQCGDACPDGVLCRTGLCLTVTTYGGYYANNPTRDHAPIPISPPSGMGRVAGVRIQLGEPGWVSALSLVANFGGTQGYLGLFAQGGTDGEPSTLLASSGLFTIQGSTSVASDVQTTTVPLIPPQYLQAGEYWLLGNWQSDVFFVRFAENAETSGCEQDCVSWYGVVVPFGPLQSVQLPYVQLAQLPEPILYATILLH